MQKHHYFQFQFQFHTTIIFIFSLLHPTLSLDTITPTTPITLNQTLVSNQQVFELGFFSLDNNNNNWYIGIWYKQIQPKTYVWVANRDNPVNSSSGKLTIGGNGNIILFNQAETTVWTSYDSNHSVRAVNTVAQLLDSGNFVLRPEGDERPESYIWESFKNPTDTLLPGMRLGWDRKTGVNRFLRSWKSGMDPGLGNYSLKMNIDGFPDIFLLAGMKPVFRSGPWNGRRFSGVPTTSRGVRLMELWFENNNDGVFFWYEMKNKSDYSRLIMTSSGSLYTSTWIESTKTWTQFWSIPRDQCDEYQKCGPWGVCDANALPLCTCMKGFRPKNEQAWDLRDGSDGCVRSSEMDCGSDGFRLMKNMKLPEGSKAFVDQTLSLNECGDICKRNCSCAAYANTNISENGSGCVIWAVDLLDVRQFADSEGGQDLYVRAAASDLDQAPRVGTSENGSGNVVKIVSITVSTCAVLIISLILFCLWRKKLQLHKNSNIDRKGKSDYSGDTPTNELELPLFDYTTLAIATNNFSDANKLGEGGFGCVYKGILMEGEVVAIKRLSKTSGQGIQELQNEVRLIAKLQHRNLVRLLGCCIEVEEKLLVYEYMEHKSLDTFLFDKEKSAQLNWQKRLDIISGIARGLLYLHQDSRFRIIHRDLKVGNILLDKNMNPKISDFGMARIFWGEQTEAKTKIVAGTYGYMSPEYAMNGIFSIKSDVFSFGVLVLEIVSGKRNKGFYCGGNLVNLIGHVWNLWNEGKALELLDESIGVEFSQDQVLRCIHIGLLCVQEHAEDRPDMSKVLMMLSSDVIKLPQPKYPGFCIGNSGWEKGPSMKQDVSMTLDKVTLTTLNGR